MKVSQKIMLVFSGMVIALSFPTFNGRLINIYDKQENNNVKKYGFTDINKEKLNTPTIITWFYQNG